MKKIKVINVILIMLILLFSITTNSYARPTDEYDKRDTKNVSLHTAGEIITEAKGFIEKGEADANDKISDDSMKSLSNTIYNILLVTGIVIAVIVGLILGIKFIMGSIEEKAEVKNMVIPYIVGCVVLFGAFTIWQIVVELLQSA